MVSILACVEEVLIGKGSPLVAAVSIFVMVLIPRGSSAFNQPPMNLGFTNFADGGPPSGNQPGFILFHNTMWIDASTFRDGNGDKLPGRNEASILVGTAELVYFTPFKDPLTGGLFGWDTIIPVVAGTVTTAADPSGTSRSNRGGLGDIIFGPALQWNDHTLFGMPYLHRFEVEISAPTGDFDPRFTFNPGSNVWTIQPHYVQTLWFLPYLNLETSFRHHWRYSTENPDTQIKPGQVYYVNYAASYGLTQSLRVGLNGYYVQQLTDDEFRGEDIENSKERVFSLGPGLLYNKGGLTFMLNYFHEFGVENRPEGYRLQGRLVYRF
jgi:hypothetical protein